MPAGRSWHFQHWMYGNASLAWMDNYSECSDVSQTTVYIGSYFEKNTTLNIATSYYAFNGQMIAMRQGATVSFLHGDHLGSASLTTNNAGVKIAETRYMPYGEMRYQWSNTLTDKRFTSQRLDNRGVVESKDGLLPQLQPKLRCAQHPCPIILVC